jgi:hypothetical protein
MKKTLLVSLFVALFSFDVMAVQYYDDGQEHDISTSISDSIEIYNDVHDLPETFTTVNIQSGGSIYGADIFDESLLNLYPGGWVGEINSHMFSNFNIINGSVDEIDLYDESHGAISGGTAYEIDVWNQSIFSVSGGEVLGTPVSPSYYTAGITTHENATVEISGGYVNKINSIGNSMVEMSDGVVSEMHLHETSSGNLTGGIVNSLTTNQNSQLVMTDVIMDEVSYVQAYDSSRVTMTGGEGLIDAMGDSVVEISNATVDVAVQENAQVTISDSQLNHLPPELRMNSSLHLNNTFIHYNNDIQLFDNSHLTASTGTGLWNVDLHNNSTFTLSGGFLIGVEARDESFVEIIDGDVMDITASGFSTIEISGGTIGDIFADESSLIVINGLDFNYGYGYITDTTGFLTGILSSGEMIETNFERYGDAQILIVPEPAALLLVGIGGVMIRRRK